MNSERLLNRFLKYVGCDSESGNERRFCELIEDEMKSIGFSVTRDEAGEACSSNGWNIYGFIPGEGEPILFSSHLDTVSPGVGICPVVENGTVRSSGDTILGADDKSGIAAVLEAAESLCESNTAHRPIEVLFSVCEEVGLLGAKFADYTLIKSKQAVVLDHGEPDSVLYKSPSNMHLHCTITGKSAHAAVSPEKGVHALKAAAKAISSIPCGHVDEETVMNVSNLLSPGKTNVVPAHASFDMEIRSFSETLLHEHADNTEKSIKEACAELGAEYELKREVVFGLLDVPMDNPFLKRLIDVYRELGIELKPEKSYGGCDAAWLFHNGIDALNVGTGMNDVHSIDENIATADLEKTTIALERLMSLD